MRAGHTTLAVQVVVLGAVRKDFCTQDAAVRSVSFTLIGADNNGSGAISEQNAGIAIRPVGNAGQGFGTNNQSRFSLSQTQHIVCHGQRIDKSRASCGKVKSGHTMTAAELGGNFGGNGRKRIVRRYGADDNQVKLFGTDAGVFQRHFGSVKRQIGSQFSVSGNMTGFNTGTFGNPLIAGFYDFRHIVIGQYLGRLIMAVADNFRSNTRHKLLPVIIHPNLIFQFRSEWSKQSSV